MCVSVMVDGEIIDDRELLQEALGAPLVFFADARPSSLEYGCLCPVDIVATAEAAGFDCVDERLKHGWDGGEHFTLTRRAK